MTASLLAILLVSSLTVAQDSDPIVKVHQGVLKGRWRESPKGRVYASFEGVPYAKPPVGEYRFRDPVEPEPWTGVWDATKPPQDCLQYFPFINQTVGSENCLFVNIHTPSLRPARPMPVLFYIHGGAFMFGAGGQHDSTNLMDRDMVVVTVNYRLGPLGFLSTGDDVVPGNAGLRDQAFALQWVQDNIRSFGGDPGSVTLSGCSAGGASVHYHYLSSLTKGNFAKGVAISGSAFSPWSQAVNPAQKARTLGALVGCPTSSSEEMVTCLRQRPAEMLIDAQIKMFDWRIHLFCPFVPTIEAPGVKNPYLSQQVYDATLAGAMHQVPLLMTFTADEGLYPAAAYQSDPTILEELESRWHELASNIFEYNETLPRDLHSTVATRIKQKYLGGKPVSQETYPQLVQALGDRHFSVGIGKLAQIHTVKSGLPVYMYRYGYQGVKSLANAMAGNNQSYGVSHADDVLHLFRIGDMHSELDEDMAMTDTLLDVIYSFATDGVPKLSHGPEWLPVIPGSSEVRYMDITSPTSAVMKSQSDFGQKSFWDSLGFLENENYQINVKDEL